MDMDRRPLIAGNWKMHTTVQEAQQLASALVLAVAKVAGRDVMIAPPYTALAAVGKILSGTGVMLGAQNVHWEEKGAFTGEISAAMLKDVGCVMAIVGGRDTDVAVHRVGESNNISYISTGGGAFLMLMEGKVLPGVAALENK